MIYLIAYAHSARLCCRAVCRVLFVAGRVQWGSVGIFGWSLVVLGVGSGALGISWESIWTLFGSSGAHLEPFWSSSRYLLGFLSVGLIISCTCVDIFLMFPCVSECILQVFCAGFEGLVGEIH